jgi:fatty acid-binding protein DegV
MSFSHVDGIAIEDAATPEEVEALAERLSSRFPKERIYRSKTSPVIGTHTGPGLLLVAVLGDKK